MSDGIAPYTSLQPMFEELRGARVLLRPYTLADAAERYAANAESRDHLRLPSALALSRKDDYAMYGVTLTAH